MRRYDQISPQTLRTIDLKHALILDVRTPIEHAEKHLVLEHDCVPLDELRPTEVMTRHGLTKHTPVYILCRSGKRAAQAAELFAMEGYSHVFVIEGGIIACELAGYALKGQAYQTLHTTLHESHSFCFISLERQIRIVSGALVALGAFLGLIIQPLWGILPLLIGCGLVVSGITDYCGMGLLLARAPWNQKKQKSFPLTKGSTYD